MGTFTSGAGPDFAVESSHVAGASPEPLQCLQVWGDNRAVDSGVTMPGLDAWVHSRPAGAAVAGGDVYYVSSCATGRIVRLLVADVSGHGASVAEIAVKLRKLMGRFMHQPDQRKLLRAINHEFLSLARLGQFATASVISCWTPTGELTVSSAGHPSPLRFDGASQAWSPLFALGEHANMPLGVDEHADFEQVKVRLGNEDMLLVFSDGLIEDRDAGGKQLAQDGVMSMLAGLAGQDHTRLVPALIDQVATRRGSPEAEDDMTVMLVRPNGVRPKNPVVAGLGLGARLIGGALGSIGRSSTLGSGTRASSSSAASS